MADELTEVLGTAPPASVHALDPAVRDRLAEQVRAARRHQLRVIEESVQVAIKGVPLAVRGVVRKALLG